MRRSDILRLPSMPAAGITYPAGPYRFIDREFMIITYESDPDLIRAALPEPLEPIDQPLVQLEWIDMQDGSGFGAYTGTRSVIPARLHGESVKFVAQAYLDDGAPVTAGREIWGFPMKHAHPKLAVAYDTLTGTLDYAGVRVALGTMSYKHESMEGDDAATLAALAETQVTLKIVPGADGRSETCQLAAVNLTEITLKGSWSGQGRLHLVPHVNAPLADLPVRRVIAARHILADLTLPYGRVAHDYLAER